MKLLEKMIASVTSGIRLGTCKSLGDIPDYVYSLEYTSQNFMDPRVHYIIAARVVRRAKHNSVKFGEAELLELRKYLSKDIKTTKRLRFYGHGAPIKTNTKAKEALVKYINGLGGSIEFKRNKWLSTNKNGEVVLADFGKDVTTACSPSLALSKQEIANYLELVNN